jgi:hypothetical protein
MRMFPGEQCRSAGSRSQRLIRLLAVLLVSLGAWEGALAVGPLPPLQQGVVVTATLRTAVRLTVAVKGVRIQTGNLDLPETSVRVRLPQLLLGKDTLATGTPAGLTVIENISIEGSDLRGDAYLLPLELLGEWSGPKSRRATTSFRLSGTSLSVPQKILAVVGTQPSGADLRALAAEADNSGGTTVSVARREAVPVFIGWFIPKEGLEGEPTPLQGQCEVTLRVP